jgi:hypothetical protein
MEQVIHPVVPAAGSDKISRSGWCSTAWPVRAGSWTGTTPASRRDIDYTQVTAIRPTPSELLPGQVFEQR